MERKPIVGITQGDPAGVGPELCVRALGDSHILEQYRPVVFGDWSVLNEVARAIGCPMPNATIHPFRGPESLTRLTQDLHTSDVHDPVVVDLLCCPPNSVTAGQISKKTGEASYRYIVTAVEAALAGSIDGIATGPIHKEAFHAAGVGTPGHTELLAQLTGCERYCMMLTGPSLSCALVTAHIGLADVPNCLSEQRILEVIELVDAEFRGRLPRRPRIVVCGLNPHAGENGLFGEGEEQRLIAPAIASAKQKGIDAVGPVPPDTAFVPHMRATTDAYVCMYHDQGLIPLKAIDFDAAINVTLGLPIRRSSVDHGTALDIAWKGTASVSSLFAAIDWVGEGAGRREP